LGRIVSALDDVGPDFCFEETFSGLSDSSASFSKDSSSSPGPRALTAAMTPRAKQRTTGIEGATRRVSKFFRLQPFDIPHFHQI